MTGTVPEELFSLPTLRTLRLNNNPELTGELTEGVSGWRDMRQLRLVDTNIGGTLPSALFDLIDLSVLELSNATFSGPLSEDFSKLGNITQIILDNNAFTGTIPRAFETLEKLRKSTTVAISMGCHHKLTLGSPFRFLGTSPE